LWAPQRASSIITLFVFLLFIFKSKVEGGRRIGGWWFVLLPVAVAVVWLTADSVLASLQIPRDRPNLRACPLFYYLESGEARPYEDAMATNKPRKPTGNKAPCNDPNELLNQVDKLKNELALMEQDNKMKDLRIRSLKGIFLKFNLVCSKSTVCSINKGLLNLIQKHFNFG